MLYNESMKQFYICVMQVSLHVYLLHFGVVWINLCHYNKKNLESLSNCLLINHF